jgi:hypothetical protein
MLSAEEATVRGRAAAMFGEAVEARVPFRVLCFHRRNALVAYHRQKATNLWNVDGLYLEAPVRTVTLTTEVLPYRLSTPESTARTLLAMVVIEDFKRSPLPAWLHQGLLRALARDDERADFDRLNRRMLAALTVGQAFGPDLFRMGVKEVFRLLQNWQHLDTYARLVQLVGQCRSIVEYLGGDDAPEDRRARFRAFVKELRPKEPDEPAFERHFGHGYGRLLEDWSAWVRGRGVGVHAPAPPDVCQAIVGRIVPIVRDRRARVLDRILAVRELGRAGFATGSDALIELLRDPGDVPVEEVLWALRSISGLDLGTDPEFWSAWSSGLPAEVVDTTVPAAAP